MKRYWIFALLIVALVAVGCGQKVEPTATPAAQAADPTATAEPE